MKLWGGRFKEATNKGAHAFNESLSFDQRLFRHDIKGSIAHVTMLASQGIISEEDRDSIINGLTGILSDIETGKLIPDPELYEDIHSFVESNLIDRIGEAGKRLHTGRSRNDQVALDTKLYTRECIDYMIGQLEKLEQVLLRMMKEHSETYMPGFTHMQKAQPVTLALHLGAYREMFLRDIFRLENTKKGMDLCPLGAGAHAGTT